MVKQPVLRKAIGLVATGGGFAVALWGVAWLFLPDLSGGGKAYTPEEVRAAQKARDVRFDPNDLPVIHQHVDYGEGPAGAWYPKGESPILAELVREGSLPPVAERVGPEPVVLKGCEGIGT